MKRLVRTNKAISSENEDLHLENNKLRLELENLKQQISLSAKQGAETTLRSELALQDRFDALEAEMEHQLKSHTSQVAQLNTQLELYDKKNEDNNRLREQVREGG